MKIEIGKTYVDGWGERHRIQGTTNARRCASRTGTEHEEKGCAFGSLGGWHWTAEGRRVDRMDADKYAIAKEVEAD